MPNAREWRIAYATQAKADLVAHEVLLKSRRAAACLHLHFLQMACEKVFKAYLCGQGTTPELLQRSHAYIANPLPVIASRQLIRSRINDSGWIRGAIRTLARKIEQLAPAVNVAGTVPANCKYPWIGSSGAIEIPAEYNFGIDLLKERAGRLLIKILYSAVEELLAE